MGDILDYFSLVGGTILIDYYGWVVVVFVLLWIFYQFWLEGQQTKFMATIKWVYLEISIDELNEKSAASMEHVFASMHATMQNFSLGETWAGKKALTFSAEIVSIGGLVSYIFKVPERYRNLLESAIFAQYPKAEIREVQDYLSNLPRTFDPVKSEFDFWGTQLVKRADNAYPIRTYRQADEFFSQKDQDTTIEPLAGVIEALSNIQPHELMSIQIVCKPTNDDWKKKGMELVGKLKGMPAKPAKKGIVDQILFDIPGSLIEALIKGLGLVGETVKKDEKPAQLLITSMSDAEKHNIDSMVLGLNKLSFEVKMRVMYLAPKDKLTKPSRIPEILGAFRSFDNPQLNGFRPDIRTVTDASFKLFQKLEQPYLDHKIFTRKNKFLKYFKDRAHYQGAGKTILNTEELATIFHFPQAPNARISQIQRVRTVKSAPPIDLPVG